MTELQDNLPPGWEYKLDVKAGRQYFIGPSRTSSTREDGKSRGSPVHHSGGESIPMQHGSPDSRRNSVYPSHPSPIPAFQMPGHNSPKYIPLQEMRSSGQFPIRTVKVQDSSFTCLPDPEDVVKKMSSMFPNVQESHIRLLMKKYKNKETVVISALQAERHSVVTSSQPEESVTKISSMFPTVSETHIKLLLKKYMKSIFPEAEEMIILDVLSSNENNIQKTSETLKEMGFSRRDVIKKNQQELDIKIRERKEKEAEYIKLPSPVPVQHVVKTKQERESVKRSLQGTYKDIPEHVISIALDSVQYDEVRAEQILRIMVQEDEKMKEKNQERDEPKFDQLTVPTSVASSQSRQSLKSLLKEKPENNNVPFSRVVEENSMNNAEYKSSNLSSTQGANLDLAKGANEKLLLEDYVKWQGPNQNLYGGPKATLAKGPDRSLLSNKVYSASGPNPELRKGAKFGLAKGSIFSQFRCIVSGGPRGK